MLFWLGLVFLHFPLSGQSWMTLDNFPQSGPRIDDIYFINQDTGWTADAAGRIFKTTDGGLSFILQMDTSVYFRSIEFLNEDIGFAGTLDSALYRTANGGESWQKIEGIDPYPPGICGIHGVSENIVFAVGVWFGPAYLLKSLDAGLTWDVLDLSSQAEALVDIFFVDETTGFIAGKSPQGGILLQTDDGGESWHEVFNSQNPGDYAWKVSAAFLDTSFIYASIASQNSQNGLIISEDGGNLWKVKQVPSLDIQGVGFISPDLGWIGGNNSPHILQTKDAGTSWTEVIQAEDINRFFIVNKELVFASGAKLHRYSKGQTSIETVFQPNIHPFYNIFPNPFHEALNFSLEIIQNERLKVFYQAIDGRISELVYDHELVAGYHQLMLNLDIKPGSYIFYFQLGQHIYSTKVIKQ